MGFVHSPFLGQNATLSLDDKKKLLKDLDQATDKTYVIDDWKKKHPNLQQDLGSDYDGWQLLDQDVAKYDSATKALYNSMVAADLGSLDISQDDQQAANYWVAAISQMYVIVANHFGKPGPVTTGPTPTATPTAAPTASKTTPAGPGGPKAPPPPPAGLPTPLIIGAGALVVFGAIMLAKG